MKRYIMLKGVALTSECGNYCSPLCEFNKHNNLCSINPDEVAELEDGINGLFKRSQECKESEECGLYNE